MYQNADELQDAKAVLKFRRNLWYWLQRVLWSKYFPPNATNYIRYFHESQQRSITRILTRLRNRPTTVHLRLSKEIYFFLVWSDDQPNHLISRRMHPTPSEIFTNVFRRQYARPATSWHHRLAPPRDDCRRAS